MGSESGPDRSKSIKTYLMPLFEAAGNFAVEVGKLCLQMDLVRTLSSAVDAPWCAVRCSSSKHVI